MTQSITTWLTSLDWSYILTFILIAYTLNRASFTTWLTQTTGIKLSTRYRTLLIGVGYGVLLYLIRGYTIEKAECLFQSLVFAFTFHKLIADKVIRLLEQLAKHNDNNPTAGTLSIAHA